MKNDQKTPVSLSTLLNNGCVVRMMAEAGRKVTQCHVSSASGVDMGTRYFPNADVQRETASLAS